MKSVRGPQYSLTVRVEVRHEPGMLAKVAGAIGDAGGSIGAIDLVSADERHTLRDIVVEASGTEHTAAILDALRTVEGATVIDVIDRTFRLHLGGKIEIHNRQPIATREDLSMAYTPGVARVCEAIQQDEKEAFRYTIKRNSVAIVSDGSAVLGLGNIGPLAAMPVMEGKAMLFKEFAGVDAYPICLGTQDTDRIVDAVAAIAPGFGGINLEDIAAPRCFEIEERLQHQLGIPVFHDDQHGTAVVVMAALLNAAKLTARRVSDLRVVVVGVGAAGVAVTRILLAAGVRHLIGCDSRGALHLEREDYLDGTMTAVKRWYVETTNADSRAGAPADVIEGADVFIGVSGPGAMPAAALATMREDAIVFALANPTPEVSPQDAARYVRIIATGRSDYPNQINNVLAFPGIFRGALDVQASRVSEAMKTAAAEAIASVVEDRELCEDYIVPSVFNREVVSRVAEVVAGEATRSGIAQAPLEQKGFRPVDDAAA